MKKIVYIGNNLTASNPTTLSLLSSILKNASFQVVVYSNKKCKLFRLLHMCWGIVNNRDANIVLIDTYSTSNFYYALLVSQLSRLLKLSYIPILHGGNLPKRLANNPRLSSLIFINAYKNVAPSNYLLKAFQDKGFETIFIPNAIVLEAYLFKKRTKLQPKLLWVRAFDTIYNPQMAVQVLAMLKIHYPETRLCMVGPDKDGSLKTVKALAEQLNVYNSIEFSGYLTKETWIEKSVDFDIFINTTNIDNIPVSVIEAMALGLPVVSTNVGGIPYLVNNNVNGLLVAKDNAAQMTEKIMELLQNPKKAVDIAENARRLVEGFDVENVQQQWIKLLK